jgi:hypothetical protein
MCDKCDEIDKKTQHYRTLAARIMDQPAIDGINQLIERLQNEKLALHPEQEK